MRDPSTTADAPESLTDPTALQNRDDIDEVTDTFPHGDADHCEADYAGRAIVGVTTDDGELLVIADRDAGAAVLPSPKVERGDDWAAAAREEVAEVAGIDVRVTGVERVRHVEHVLGDDDAVFDETTHVVLAATPVEDDPELPDHPDESWSVEWHDSVPSALVDEDGAEADDVRLFVD